MSSKKISHASVDELLKLGFKDVSADMNGLAYRLALPNGIMELCLYVNEGTMRLQTQRSGFTVALNGVSSIDDVKDFYYKMFGTYPGLTKKVKAFLAEQNRYVKIAWHKYPLYIPFVDTDDHATYSDKLIVLTSTDQIIDNVRYREESRKFVTNPFGYDHDSTEVENVEYWTVLQSLKPVN